MLKNILGTVVRFTLNTPIAEYVIKCLILMRKIINLFSLGTYCRYHHHKTEVLMKVKD